jgi:hypothetical protein
MQKHFHSTSLIQNGARPIGYRIFFNTFYNSLLNTEIIFWAKIEDYDCFEEFGVYQISCNDCGSF